jgi:hypothetical protein
VEKAHAAARHLIDAADDPECLVATCFSKKTITTMKMKSVSLQGPSVERVYFIDPLRGPQIIPTIEIVARPRRLGVERMSSDQFSLIEAMRVRIPDLGESTIYVAREFKAWHEGLLVQDPALANEVGWRGYGRPICRPMPLLMRFIFPDRARRRDASGTVEVRGAPGADRPAVTELLIALATPQTRWIAK